MKKLFWSALFLYPLILQAQVSVPLKTRKLSDVFATVDSVIHNAKDEYVLAKSDTAQGKSHGSMYFKLAGKNNQEKEIYIRFLKSKEAGNSGATLYYLTGIEGSFPDLFSFWRKFAQPDADKDKIIKEEGSYLLLKEGDKQRRVNLKKVRSSTWSIQII